MDPKKCKRIQLLVLEYYCNVTIVVLSNQTISNNEIGKVTVLQKQIAQKLFF